MTNRSESSWEKVVRDFRRLCLARRQQRQEESDHVLHADLPQSIAEWSRTEPGDAHAKKAQLDQMFQREQRRIDDAWVLHELLSLRLADELVPTICSRVGDELRRITGAPAAPPRHPAGGTRPLPMAMLTPRVAIDDIPGIIDLLLNEELNQEFCTR